MSRHALGLNDLAIGAFKYHPDDCSAYLYSTIYEAGNGAVFVYKGNYHADLAITNVQVSAPIVSLGHRLTGWRLTGLFWLPRFSTSQWTLCLTGHTPSLLRTFLLASSIIDSSDFGPFYPGSRVFNTGHMHFWWRSVSRKLPAHHLQKFNCLSLYHGYAVGRLNKLLCPSASFGKQQGWGVNVHWVLVDRPWRRCRNDGVLCSRFLPPWTSLTPIMWWLTSLRAFPSLW